MLTEHAVVSACMLVVHKIHAFSLHATEGDEAMSMYARDSHLSMPTYDVVRKRQKVTAVLHNTKHM